MLPVAVVPFGRIRWVKSVALGEDELAYAREDPTVRAREPRRRGDLFELHSTPEDAESLQDPEPGDLIVLVQHGYVTHLARIVSERVEPRPKSTIRRGTRDHRFSMQRTCALEILCDYEHAPTLEEAFGFDPRAGGGEVFAILELEAFEASGQPAWAVQRRIVQAMTKADRPARRPSEGPMRKLPPGPGRVDRTPSAPDDD